MLRTLGPAHRVRHEGDAIGSPGGPHVTVHPDHEVHVLADGLVPEAADLHQHVLPEHPEGAGDEHEGAELAPGGPPIEKRPQVLDHLRRAEPGARHPHTGNAGAPAELAAVRDPDAAAGRDGLRRPRQNRVHDRCHRVALEHAVGIDDADVGRGRQVDAGVGRVGLAAVHLVQHPEAGVRGAPVDPVDRLALDPLPVDPGRAAQPELGDQPVEGIVARAVVHHDQLEPGIAQREQRAHRLDDRHALVVGRHDDRDRGREAGLADVAEVLQRDGPQAAAHRAPADHELDEIDRVDGGEVAGDEQGEDRELAHAASPSASARMKSVWAAMSRTNGLASRSASRSASAPGSSMDAMASATWWRTQ